MPTCQYGEKCYRKNAEHLKEFHPEKISKKDPQKPSTSKQAKITQFSKKRAEAGKDEPNVKENTVPSPKRQCVMRPPLRLPKQVEEFMEHLRSLNPKDPLNMHQLDGLHLVGPFELLEGLLDDLTDEQLRLHHRYPTDLPEMQTIAVYNKGRFALWRDEPSSSDCLIVHVDGDDHFPHIQVIGDHPAYILLHLNPEEKLFPPNMEAKGMKNHAKKVIARRRREAIGSPIHGTNGPRIRVNVVNDVGYRPIPENPASLKKLLNLIGNTDDEELREAKMCTLRGIFSYVQMGTDECDFGMGLEMGHDLFLANYPTLDRHSKAFLILAYDFLNRSEFSEIIRVQFEEGNRRREDYSMLSK